MDYLSRLPNLFKDPRLTANLVAVHGLIVLVVILCLVLRRLVTRSCHKLGERTGFDWLDPVGREAARRARRMVLWLTLATIVALAVLTAVYHIAGRDVRDDWNAWQRKQTTEYWIQMGTRAAIVAGLLFGAWLAVRALRRLRIWLEGQVTRLCGCGDNQEYLKRSVALATQFTGAAVFLLVAWGAGQIVERRLIPGAGAMADAAAGLLLHLLGILAAARLLPLLCKALSPNLAALGNRYLGRGRFRLYWERLVRLFPLGERCFEAAVYIEAAAAAVRVLNFIMVVAEYGPLVVRCIGIFFCTRVLIELLQVLFNQAFGLYSEDRHVNQKARTVVPLLNSVCQYVLYFGSGMLMLDEFQINTMPIMAGAGILGLAVGLGAQNLVTDLVSGFFILFESQYLVGDYVEIGHARGIVEEVGIRLTQVRDGNGKLHLIPNGQIKTVVNYSKGYVNAVVDVKVASGSDLEDLFRSMTEAGRRLRLAHVEVLADTQIHGLVDLGTSDMTVRAITKVRPGTHDAMESEYRRMLKQVFDENRRTMPAARIAA
jgi:small conductance mechanosensitive channel